MNNTNNNIFVNTLVIITILIFTFKVLAAAVS